MKRIAVYLLICSLLYEETPVPITEEEIIKDISSYTGISVEEVKKYYKEIDEDIETTPQSPSIFRPVSATISDSEGTFSSSNFDCPNMMVYDMTNDGQNKIRLLWGGEDIMLYPEVDPDTYIASQSKGGITMKFVAYRSSSTREIYLVICTTKGNGQSVDIDFKP